MSTQDFPKLRDLQRGWCFMQARGPHGPAPGQQASGWSLLLEALVSELMASMQPFRKVGGGVGLAGVRGPPVTRVLPLLPAVPPDVGCRKGGKPGRGRREREVEDEMTSQASPPSTGLAPPPAPTTTST